MDDAVIVLLRFGVLCTFAVLCAGLGQTTLPNSLSLLTMLTTLDLSSNGFVSSGAWSTFVMLFLDRIFGCARARLSWF